MTFTPIESPLLELRRYTLHPGQRDTLIDLFDREFVESQEALDMRVIGQFRDLDDPQGFVWLRGFADMTSRRASLEAFYDGPVWRAHRDAANATMVDWNDVFLLRPAWPGAGHSGPNEVSSQRLAGKVGPAWPATGRSGPESCVSVRASGDKRAALLPCREIESSEPKSLPGRAHVLTRDCVDEKPAHRSRAPRIS